MNQPFDGPTPELQDYWHIACRRRWWILGTLFSVWALAWTVSWVLPAKYRSGTTVLLQQQKVPQEYVESNVAIDTQERLNTIADQILSRARLQRIIDQFQLYAKDRNRLSPDELVDRMRRDIEIEIQATPATSQKQQLTAFRLYYSAPNPLLAQQITGQLTSLFIQEDQAEQQQQSASTTQFLAAEVEQARQKVADCNQRLADFKERYVGQLPSQAQGNLQLLAGLQSRYDNLMSTLHSAQAQKLYLESLLNQYLNVGLSSETNPDTPASIDLELVRLHNALDNARGQYSDLHPDVVALKAQIAEAERRKQRLESSAKQRLNSMTRTPTPTDLQAMSPKMQIEGQLRANQQQINDTQTQLKALEPQIAAYRHRLQLSPLREQELADLTREYDQASETYDALLKKQSQSQLATNMENRQQGMQFTILDAPNLPDKVHSPNRIKLSLGGLFFGLVLGVALAFVMEKAGSRIYTERDLAEAWPSQLPAGLEVISTRVLVGIPHLSTSAEERWKKKRHVLECVAIMVLLLGIAAGNAFSIRMGYDSGQELRNVSIDMGQGGTK